MNQHVISAGPPPDRLCVYTVLLGNYEALNEQPVARTSLIPFICFTDDPQLHSQTWRLRRIDGLFKCDPIRSQREVKLRPHKHLPDFDASLYIDNSVLLTQDPDEVFRRYFPQSGLALPGHSYRNSVLDEFLQVYKRGFDDHGRVLEQLNHYTLSCPEVLDEAPYWTGIRLADHRNEAARQLLDLWLMHVLRYSRRDQLSINYVSRQLNFVPDRFDLDNYASPFHTWPHVAGRNREMGQRSPLTSLMHIAARVHLLEAEGEILVAENAMMRRRLRNTLRGRIAELVALIRRSGS
jgi:hypothetical protein